MKAIVLLTLVVPTLVIATSCRNESATPREREAKSDYQPISAALAPPSNAVREIGVIILDVVIPEPDVVFIGDQQFTKRQFTELLGVLAKNKGRIHVDGRIGKSVSVIETSRWIKAVAPNISAVFRYLNPDVAPNNTVEEQK